MNEHDPCGTSFNLKTFFESRNLCLKTTEKIISQITPGLGAQEIEILVKEEFKKIGVNKFWHPTKIRIGEDTLKSFRDPANLSLLTQKSEICFLDLGPVIDGHEADIGRTFLVGTDLKNDIILAAESVFQQSLDAWKEAGLSGLELFNFAHNKAEELGFQLNPRMAGHRLGDFPHRLFSSEKLFELNRRPTENLWVLEIHLLDKSLKQGAFFEDLLIY